MPTPDKIARVVRRSKLEMLRAADDNEDLSEVLELSLERLGVSYCVPCLSAGFRTRVHRRGMRCINHWRSERSAA